MSDDRNASYFAYWGKAQPHTAGTARYHLLPYHCLDVAACGQELFRIPRFSLVNLSTDLGWDVGILEDLCLVFLAIHDIGKFAGSFQARAGDLGSALVAGDPRQICKHRHDTLGWIACRELAKLLPKYDPSSPAMQFLSQLARIFTGHHGKPPSETEGHSDPQTIRSNKCFRLEDLAAAEGYVRDVLKLFLRTPLPPIVKAQISILARHSWTLAGLAVLADWLGSNSDVFRYFENPMNLSRYWTEIALPAARKSIASAGLSRQKARGWTGAKALLPKLRDLTPLQEYAASVSMTDGPQFFLLEDVTGSGKTEAALLLCHRLMASGKAEGFYFALPTMATANQMYQRVGHLYRSMFAEDASPSLVLAHGAREIVEDFRESVLQTMPVSNDKDDLPRVGAQCNAWLADSRKKALLADAGVGTVDQALLGVLPVRHQSLRLLGLASKVLVVDEVHAYDSYTSQLLQTMVCAQAQQGGSVVLLSATVPAILRAALVDAFQNGAGNMTTSPVPDNFQYPLATHADRNAVRSQTCPTRRQMIRVVGVETMRSETEVVEQIVCWSREGRAACWIRNTVDDARRVFGLLQQHVDPQHLTLFHSRFAMGDRLRIEEDVLTRFGSTSATKIRRGQVLIATQVVEQSLDLDFDEMVVDLAPVDLVIQRAGRLKRHIRDAAGNPAILEGRTTPVLHVLAPVFTDDPAEDWYKAMFPKAAYVYQDHGQLWLTLRALTGSGAIATPGKMGEPGSVRSLMELVYGEAACPVPRGLAIASQNAEGKRRTASSLAGYNVLKLRQGYCISAGDWDAADKTPTRLGDDGCPIYLAKEQDGHLVPLLDERRYPWERSFLRVDLYRMDGITPEWQARFSTAIAKLQQTIPLLSADSGAVILPLIADGDSWTGWCQFNGRPQQVRYDQKLGLLL